MFPDILVLSRWRILFVHRLEARFWGSIRSRQRTCSSLPRRRRLQAYRAPPLPSFDVGGAVGPLTRGLIFDDFGAHLVRSLDRPDLHPHFGLVMVIVRVLLNAGQCRCHPRQQVVEQWSREHPPERESTEDGMA